MARAISGAYIIKEWEGPYTNQVIYRQRCDNCGYFPPHPAISIRLEPYGTVAYGTYHVESFICPFCGNRQVVKLEG